MDLYNLALKYRIDLNQKGGAVKPDTHNKIV